jgi:hypothetical protein
MFILSGCGSKATATVDKVTPKVKVTAQSIFDKLKITEGSYMTNIEVVTAENDENKLLGRPNQYTEKINWNDNRLKDSMTNCSIELFSNATDAISRKTYLEGVIKAMPTFVQYISIKDNVIVRIEGALTPTQSDEYIKIFNSK